MQVRVLMTIFPDSNFMFNPEQATPFQNIRQLAGNRIIVC
jgi:hypothetical protein